MDMHPIAHDIFSQPRTHGFWQRVYHANMTLTGPHAYSDGILAYALEMGMTYTDLAKNIGDVVQAVKGMPAEWLAAHNTPSVTTPDDDPVFLRPASEIRLYRKASVDARKWSKLPR